MVKVTWDAAKNRANRSKHGVAFEDVSDLFASGVDYLELYDELHSDDEERFIAIGPVGRNLYVVVWVESEDDAVRIISARKATRRERVHFRSFMEKRR
jgi:hypothetical protein